MEKGLIGADSYWNEVINHIDEIKYSEIMTLAVELIMKIVKAFVTLHSS
jgi:hypothetical protein